MNGEKIENSRNIDYIQPENAAAPPTDTAEGGECNLEQEIQTLVSQVDEMKDKYLRALAEMDNMKKRLQRERENIVKYGTENLLREFLRVYDGIEKSIHTAQELHPEDKHFISGLEMVERLFLETLKRFHVEPIDTKGVAFDPSYHEAMLHVDKPGIAVPGLVLDELEKGFMLHDRVLRPSRVTVSKGIENTTKEEIK